MIKNIFTVIIFIAGSVFLFKVMTDVLDTPDKLVSYSTKKCVMIVTIKGDKLPCSEAGKFRRLNHVWIE